MFRADFFFGVFRKSPKTFRGHAEQKRFQNHRFQKKKEAFFTFCVKTRKTEKNTKTNTGHAEQEIQAPVRRKNTRNRK